MRGWGWCAAVLGLWGALGCDGGDPPPPDPDGGVMDAYVPEVDAGPPEEPIPIPIDLACAATLDEPVLVRALAIDRDGSVYVLGGLYGDVDLDPGPGVERYVSPVVGTQQSFLARFEPDCTYAWTRVFDPNVDVRGLGLDAAGTVVVVGDPQGDGTSIDFDPTDGNDRRLPSGLFVTRLRADGSYVSTIVRDDCDFATCGAPPSGVYDVAVAADGTVYVSTLRELYRVDDARFGWDAVPPDGGVPFSGRLDVAPDGALWVIHPDGAGDQDPTPGIDSPTTNCRPDDTTCIERFGLTWIEPDGSYGGTLAQPPNQVYAYDDFAIDGAGDLHLVGRFASGTSDVLAPNFDFAGGVDRWGGTGFYAAALTPEGHAIWTNTYGVGMTTTASSGPSYFGAIAIDRDLGIVYRTGNFVASIGTRTGILFTESNMYDGFLVAETLDGQPLWSTTLGAARSPPGPDVVLAAGRGGRFALAFRGPDIDITPYGVRAPDGPGPSIAVYEPERCADGATRPSVCPTSTPVELTCASGRWGPNPCDTSYLEMARYCLRTCGDQSAFAVACGTHDDGCGGTESCGTCAGPMVCAGPGRTCNSPDLGAVATGLNHPSYLLRLDATHAYVVTQNDFVDGAAGERPSLESIWRAPRDGSGAPTELVTGGPGLSFAVDATHLYWTDPAAGTFSRRPKDGTGTIEVLATGLVSPGGVLAVDDRVHFTTALDTEPTRPRWLYTYVPLSFFLARSEGLGFEPSGMFVDATHVWVSAAPPPGGDAQWHRWPRGEVGLPAPELVIGTRLSMVAIDGPGGYLYGTLRFDNSLYRQRLGTFGGAPELVRSYGDPRDIPAPGYFDGTGTWYLEYGEFRQHTWTGRLRYGVLATGESQIAHSGLDHPVAIAGDASGLFVATQGGLQAHGDTGEIVRIW